jgi:hypothetical protein
MLYPAGRTYRTYVYPVSLNSLLNHGFEANDNGQQEKNLYEGPLQNDAILSKLTKRQREIIIKLNDGYKRKEVAHDFGICIQAVHQIVLRIRKRLQTKKAIDYDGIFITKRELLLKNLTYFYCITSRVFDAQAIFNRWDSHAVLNDYEKPDISLLKKWINEFVEEINEK